MHCKWRKQRFCKWWIIFLFSLLSAKHNNALFLVLGLFAYQGTWSRVAFTFMPSCQDAISPLLELAEPPSVTWPAFVRPWKHHTGAYKPVHKTVNLTLELIVLVLSIVRINNFQQFPLRKDSQRSKVFFKMRRRARRGEKHPAFDSSILVRLFFLSLFIAKATGFQAIAVRKSTALYSQLIE